MQDKHFSFLYPVKPKLGTIRDSKIKFSVSVKIYNFKSKWLVFKTYLENKP